MIQARNEFIQAMTSPIDRTMYVKIELLDSQYNYIREITKQVTKDGLGTLAVNGSTPIRRSFSLTLDNKDNEFLFGEDNLVWIDKRLKLYIGLELSSGEIEYVPQGVFVLTEPVNTHDTSKKETEINAVDKAYLMTDKLGKFVNNQTIEEGVKITDAIRIIASHVGETMFNFDDVQDTVPYELTYEGTDNRWTALEELAKLAKCTIFYDVYGYLRLKKIDLNSFDNEPITWEYKYGQRQYAGTIRKFNDTELYNDIVVLGGSSDTATSYYRLTVDETNPIWQGHKYSVQKIGWHTYFHNDGNPDSVISTDDECKWRAKYELMNHLGFIEDVSVMITPNYLHDVDDVIWIEDKNNGIEGNKFIIKSFNLPLSPQIMTIECSRMNKVINDWNFT